jgi:hypothetical protein
MPTGNIFRRKKVPCNKGPVSRYIVSHKLAEDPTHGKVSDCLTKKPGEHVAIRQRAPITARWIVDVSATYQD